MATQPKAVRHFRLPVALNYELEEAADQLGVSPSVLLRKATRFYLRSLKNRGGYIPVDIPPQTVKKEVMRRRG